MREAGYLSRKHEREEICRTFWPENVKDCDKFVCMDVDEKKLLKRNSLENIQ